MQANYNQLSGVSGKDVAIASTLLVLFGGGLTAYLVNKNKNKIYSLPTNKVLEVARKYIGQTEIYQDKGFDDKQFEQKMKAIGWKVNLPWCAYFIRLVFLEAFENEKRQLLKQLISSSSQQTFANFKKNEKNYNWFSTSKNLQAGSIAVWQSQKNQSRGHLAIVESVSNNGFISIDGNSGANPPRIKRTNRSLNEFNETTGNKLIGFVNFK